MFLSFVVPVYNAAQYLPECLDSLLAQDISDYEIICVNDGSRDASPEILGQYAAEHGNIRVIDKENGGVVSDGEGPGLPRPLRRGGGVRRRTAPPEGRPHRVH